MTIDDKHFRKNWAEVFYGEEPDDPPARKSGMALCACLFVFLVLFSSVGRAEDTPDGEFRARGVVCETKEQMLKFLKAFNTRNLVDALKKANGDLPVARACGTAYVLVSVVKKHEPVDTPTGEWTLTELLVHGKVYPNGMVRRFTIPLIQYTAFRPDGWKPETARRDA